MKTCPVCGNDMTKGYCMYGCAYDHLSCAQPYKTPKARCKICAEEFEAYSSHSMYCGKECRKKAVAAQNKTRRKVYRERFANRQREKQEHHKLREPSPEEILIDKEIEAREKLFAKARKIECDYCKYTFRTYDKEKIFCSKECEKKREKANRARKTLAKLENVKCVQCDKYFGTSAGKILCPPCLSLQKALQKPKDYIQKWGESEYKHAGTASRNRKNNTDYKLNMAAICPNDPVTKRLKVMRG